MLSGLNPESFERRLALLESKERQHNTDIIRLWQTVGNLIYKNQTNQPGGNLAPSSSSSPPSSPPPSSSPWPPDCPDEDPGGSDCVFEWRWYGGSDGWVLIAGGPAPCCTSDLAVQPSADGEYIGQICFTWANCPSSSSSPPPGGGPECDPGYSPCGETCTWIWSSFANDWFASACSGVLCNCQGKPDEPGSFNGQTASGICCSL